MGSVVGTSSHLRRVLRRLTSSLCVGSGWTVCSRIRYSILFPKSTGPQRRQNVVSCSNPFRLHTGLFRVCPFFVFPYALTKLTCRFTWITFIAVAAVVGRAVSFSNDPETLSTTTERFGVGIYWGQSPWLILGAATVHFGWVYEAVRWRVSLM